MADLPLRDKIATLFLCVLGVLVVLSMVLQPSIAYEAAVEGLETWWGIVFPALLPFFIGSQILLGLGVVHAMGVMLEPIMRPLFNVPGCGSFVLAMGLASGYPIGAVLTGNMRRDSMLNKYEGERLVSAANTADPLFMSGAIAVGMFNNVTLAPLIMAAHYISALLNGLIVRFYAPRAPRTKAPEAGHEPVPARAVRAMFRARAEDGRPLGSLMGDAVQKSINTLLIIGGFIILLSVVINVLEAAPLAGILGAVFSSALAAVGLSGELAPAVLRGTFEITLGCQATASSMTVPLADRLILTGAVVAWSGLSVHAQVAALLHDTDINVVPYMTSRMIHGCLAGVITWLLLPYAPQLSTGLGGVLPVLALPSPAAGILTWGLMLKTAARRFVAVWALLTVLGLAACLVRPARR